MEFYKVLQQIMDERGLTIAGIARASGVSDGTIRSAIVRRQKNVALDVACKISQGLNVSLDYLNNGEEKVSAETAKQKAAPENNEGGQKYDVPQEYYLLSATNRQTVDVLIRHLADAQDEKIKSVCNDISEVAVFAYREHLAGESKK